MARRARAPGGVRERRAPVGPAAGVVTVVHSHPTPVIDRATAAKFGVQGGFETGNALKLNGTYHLFYGERAPPTTYPWKMGWTTQIGHWTSPDGLACEPHPLPPAPPGAPAMAGEAGALETGVLSRCQKIDMHAALINCEGDG